LISDGTKKLFFFLFVLALSFLPLSQSDNQMTERVLVVVVVGLAHSPYPPSLYPLHATVLYKQERGRGMWSPRVVILTHAASTPFLSLFYVTVPPINRHVPPTFPPKLSLNLPLSCYVMLFYLGLCLTFLGSLKGQVRNQLP
jgi:hypothetical protein